MLISPYPTCALLVLIGVQLSIVNREYAPQGFPTAPVEHTRGLRCYGSERGLLK
jgi:hypothetical protein